MTAGIVGMLLVPYSFELLLKIVAGLTVLTMIISFAATWKIENNLDEIRQTNEEKAPLLEELKSLWKHSKTRNFTIFVFLSMTAYFMQELILEPYAGMFSNILLVKQLRYLECKMVECLLECSLLEYWRLLSNLEH